MSHSLASAAVSSHRAAGGVMKPAITSATDPAAWPVLLTVADMATVLRVSPKHVYRVWTSGERQPQPVMYRGDVVRPIRWHRDVVRRFIQGAK